MRWQYQLRHDLEGDVHMDSQWSRSSRKENVPQTTLTGPALHGFIFTGSIKAEVASLLQLCTLDRGCAQKLKKIRMDSLEIAGILNVLHRCSPHRETQWVRSTTFLRQPALLSAFDLA